jgi:exopolysaccharide biosynthesis polyprenyl glycosylphosphotransferase
MSAVAIRRGETAEHGCAERARSLRVRLGLLSLAVDVTLGLLGYELAFVVFRWFHHVELPLTAGMLDWGIPLGLAAIVICFLCLGLYKLEAYVSRALQLMTMAKGVVIALVITAFLAFSFKSPLVTESRLTLFASFAAFFVMDAVARLWLLDRLVRDDARCHRGGTLVIGASSDSSVVVSRCRELRGYAPVGSLEPLDKRRNGYDAEPALLRALAEAEPAPRQVFLDGASLGHKATFDLIGAARARGADVYVTGRLASPLDTTKMLFRLFEMPTMRVRHEPATGGRLPFVKRAFDVAVAAAGLVLLAPAFAVIAIFIKRDSPGPVFFRQARVGWRGRSLGLLKFRTMAADNDDAAYREHSLGRIRGDEAGSAAGGPATDEYGRPILKLADDERITRIGNVLRRYSLDELPQFWNVLKGDMSMVGPRPALDYEVAAYAPWHRRRLEVAPGVSGLWQVAGRSRVDFDEMVFQDVIYSYNQSLLTDVSLCLRTIPAILSGRGAV